MRIYWTPEQPRAWVVEDDLGLWAIPAGGGPRDVFSGDPALLQPLDDPSGDPMLLRVQLVGVPEIAARAGVQPDTVRKWRQRHRDFPAPLTNLAAGPVWSWSAVDRWMRTHSAASANEQSREPLRRGAPRRARGQGPRWSPASASLFTPVADEARVLALPTSGASAWPVYAQGYRMAGDLVLRTILDTGHDQDFLVYPLIFLYRQYLELQLKQVIHIGRELHGGRGRPVDTHSLAALWDHAVTHIRQEWPKDDLDSTIRRDLQEFDAVDGGSYAFRYPVGTLREPSLPVELERLNVRTFALRADEIGNYLDGAIEGLWHHRDSLREMAAEYAP